MYSSLGDLVRTATSHRRREERPEARLRGQAWLSHALLLSGKDGPAFARDHVYRAREDSGLFRKWQSGSASVSRQSALAVEKSLPGSLWVFDLPLWELLANRPVSSRAMRAIARRNTRRFDEFVLWFFPGDDELASRGDLLSVFHPDTQGLVSRGDLWGFIGTVIATRTAEAASNMEGHIEISKDMYRALPSALKVPWLRPHAVSLLDRLDAVRRRMFYSSLLYDVDRDVVLRQADDPDHQPCRELRKRDPRTLRFVEIEDPIVLARIILPRTRRASRSRSNRS